MSSRFLGLDFSRVAGIPIAAGTPEEAADWVCTVASSSSHRGIAIHLVNAYTIALADQDAEYRSVLHDKGSVNFPDGKPLAWVSRNKGARLTQVRGPALFESVMDLGRDKGIRHFLLGTTPETLHILAGSLRERYPGVAIVGAYSPPFRKLSAEEVRAQDELIRESGADVVWVGLGTPKQDFEAARLANSLQLPVVAVGAAFDFSAGVKREAPTYIRAVGLEWLFRMLCEPRRLWRRYLFGNARFLRAALIGPAQ